MDVAVPLSAGRDSWLVQAQSLWFEEFGSIDGGRTLAGLQSEERIYMCIRKSHGHMAGAGVCKR